MWSGATCVQQVRAWRAGESKSTQRAFHELEREISALLGLEVTVTDRSDLGGLRITMEGEPYDLHEVGSGTAQAIVVLLQVAMKRPYLLLVDEPELHLHPSLAVNFVGALARRAPGGMLFATHSLGLARSVADQVVSVQRIAAGRSKTTRMEDDGEAAVLLRQLSYSTAPDVGFDRVLLVEGASEVRVFQALLRAHRKDQRVFIFPLGGDALASGKHVVALAEFKRLNVPVSAFVDSERTAVGGDPAAGRLAFERACRELDFTCALSERRATENYFTTAAVRKVKRSEKYRGLEPFEAFNALPCGWNKAENWRIAEAMTAEDWAATDLGRFVAAL